MENDLTQLGRLPSSPLRDASILRTRARVECLTRDRATAIELIRKSLASFQGTAMLQEIAHDQYCLGALIGGAEGVPLVASARQTFSAYGISDPETNMRAYVPELMR